MRTAVRGAACFVAGGLLAGCGSSPAVRQAKLDDPIIVVTVQNTPKKTKEPPAKTLVDAKKVAKADIVNKDDDARAGILGVLSAADPSDPNGVFGGVVGGVIGAPAQGFGGLGLSGVGIGGGGTGQGTIGLGAIGTLSRGSQYGMIGLVGRGSGERVKAKLGSVVVTGPLTLDVVQRHIDEHRDDVQRCYRLELSGNGPRWGSATFQFTIDTTGHVSDVQVYDSTLTSRDLESCIAHTIGAFEFPSPGSGNGATIRLPITF